jgi:tetratricopeptide (TPR) repeat protein
MKAALIRINLICLLLTFFIPNITSAELKIFIKEYTYQASEADSKLSSRTIALREVKRLLLEDLGTYLESVTEVQNFQLRKDKIVTITAGIVRTEIIDEKWDGHTYWLRTKIAADSGDVIKSIDILRKDRLKTKELEEIRKRSDDLLKENARLRKELATSKGEKRQKELTEYNQTIKELTAVEWFESGFALERSSNYRDAIDAYSKAIELGSKKVDIYWHRAFSYNALGDFRLAINDFNIVIQSSPDNYDAYKMRGRAFESLGDLKQAVLDYGKAIAFVPKNKSYYDHLGMNYLNDAAYKWYIANYYYDRANAYKKLKNYKSAVIDYDKVIELAGDDPSNFSTLGFLAYYERAVVNAVLENYNQSIKDYDQVLKSWPEEADASFYIGQGNVHMKIGSCKKAIADFEKALILKRDDTWLLVSLGLAHECVKNYKEAISNYDKAIEIDAGCASAYYYKGHVYATVGEYDQAINNYSMVIKLDKNNIAAYVGRGIVYGENLRKYQDAISDFSRAVELNSNDAGLYYLRGYNYERIADRPRAIKDYKTAARMGHKSAQERLNDYGVSW